MRYLSLILICVLSLSSIVSAQVAIDTKNLTPAQIAQLQLEAEKMKNDGGYIERAKEYVELGTMIGKALGSSAKELGVAVNDFAGTPVGQMTTFLIMYKMMGRDIMHYIGGVGFIAVFLPIWFYLLRRICLIDEITYDPATKKKISVKYGLAKDKYGSGYRNEWMAWFIAMLFIIVGVGSIIFWA